MSAVNGQAVPFVILNVAPATAGTGVVAVENENARPETTATKPKAATLRLAEERKSGRAEELS